jgi:hypothetical protein
MSIFYIGTKVQGEHNDENDDEKGSTRGRGDNTQIEERKTMLDSAARLFKYRGVLCSLYYIVPNEVFEHLGAFRSSKTIRELEMK